MEIIKKTNIRLPFYTLFFVLFLKSFQLQAQLTNKGNFIISSNSPTYVYINGIDLINDNGTTYTYKNEGNVIFTGANFVNNGTMVQTMQGVTKLTGNNAQNIKGTQAAYFNNLVVDNTSNTVTQVENDVHTNAMTVNDGTADFDYKVNDGFPLYVKDALTTNGDIRLVGEAQLIQTHTGTSQVSGSKYIWIDQQGTTNQYYYNYWSAPVNRNSVWKVSYLKDGANGDNMQKSTYGDIQTVNNTNSVNDLPAQTSHPVFLNAYWFYAFKNGAADSSQGWVDNHIQDTGTVNPAEGYTMKGPGVDAFLQAANGPATTEYASWTFSGTPNDGEYSLNINENHDYLVGNPYPCALDANAFIHANTDNNPSFNGNLYFWEHTGGSDHLSSHYQGGYAIWNLTGGTPATDWQTGNTTVGTKTPKQYVPVGQGFFIWAVTGQSGTVTFNNSMRVFNKESSNNSIFIRQSGQTNIRLGFSMENGAYHRQLLLGVRPNTTNGIDVAWDGQNVDSDFPSSDMRWLIENQDFIIQAIPNLDINSRLPLHVLATADNMVSFNIDEVENLPTGLNEIYIEDTSNHTFHRIDSGNTYDLMLQTGDYNDRFYLTFRNSTLDTQENTQLENIITYLDENSRELVILNHQQQSLKEVYLYAMTGQKILNKKLYSNETEIRIPVNIAIGVYLVNITSTNGLSVTEKVLKR